MVHAFGDAQHRGDLGAIQLAAPVLAALASPAGDGYYLVAADGGVFAFGDAVFLGSVPEILPGVDCDPLQLGRYRNLVRLLRQAASV